MEKKTDTEGRMNDLVRECNLYFSINNENIAGIQKAISSQNSDISSLIRLLQEMSSHIEVLESALQLRKKVTN